MAEILDRGRRPTLVRMRADDLDRSVDSPALQALVDAGWSVVATFHAEEAGVRYLVLLMTPPPPPPTAPTLAERVVVGSVAGGAAGLLVGAALLWAARVAGW